MAMGAAIVCHHGPIDEHGATMSRVKSALSVLLPWLQDSHKVSASF